MNLNMKKISSLILAGSLSLCCAGVVGNINSSRAEKEKSNKDKIEKEIDKKAEHIKYVAVKGDKEIVFKEKEEVEKDPKKLIAVETTKKLIATATVNIRKLPNEDSEVLGVLNNNNTIDMIEKENDSWYKVKYNDSDAYINSKFVEEKEETEILTKPKKTVYVPETIKLYDDKKRKEEISEIPSSETLKVYKSGKKYYITDYNGIIGYINKEQVEDLDDIFVVVDISDQTATLYKDGEEKLTSPVVTGKNSTPTSKGLFEIFEISHNRYLVGPGYRSYVHVMMKFNGGQGLHDAPWRGEFGGEIYKYSGSHGCVNMPYDAAMEISENVNYGTKVLVKE